MNIESQQLTTILSSAAVVAVLLALINGVRSELSSLRDETRTGFAAVRFDDMRDLWRAELRRVEEVMDARLRNMEER
ncbi:MAG: hypothetical protein H7Y20_00925 [Bryobacteraceae bacterium]|nr:hypothetical protein [Bryobacteraceae bacterium]